MATGTFNHPTKNDSPCTLTTGDGGSIQYWVRTTGSPYTETFTRQGGGRASEVKLIVGWNDSANFLKWALGYSQRPGNVGSRLQRFLPMANPYTTNQYLESLTLVQCEADVDATYTGPEAEVDPSFDGWPKYDWCVYTAKYAAYPFRFQTDAELDVEGGGLGLGKEWNRYCTKSVRVIAREQKYPAYTFETYCPENISENGTPVTQVGFLPDWEQEIVYRLHEWPLDCFPMSFIAERLATVNDNTFAGLYAAGTLLFKGVSDITIPYQMANGEWAVDWSVVMGYRPNGWNYYRGLDKVYRPVRVIPITPTGSGSGSGSGCLATVDVEVVKDPPTRPYSESDFTYIFRPGFGI